MKRAVWSRAGNKADSLGQASDQLVAAGVNATIIHIRGSVDGGMSLRNAQAGGVPCSVRLCLE